MQPTKKKLKKIGDVTHVKSGITIEYFLEGTQFVATVFERPMSAPDASVLRQKILDRIEHWMTLEWHPVIEVKMGSGWRDDDDTLELDYERYYISKGPAGSVVKCEWDVAECHRKAKATWSTSDRDSWTTELKLTKLPLEAPLKMGNGHLLPYSEKVWIALQSIEESIGILKKRLKALITTQEGIQKLEAGSNKLLLSEGK